MRFSPTGRGARAHFCGALGVVELLATPTQIQTPFKGTKVVLQVDHLV